jgi:hypothetical protein
MNLQQRIDALVHVGQFIQTNHPNWKAAKERAHRENGWFTEDHIDTAAHNAVTAFLNRAVLESIAHQYQIERETRPRKIGIVMAGNIPMVGLHDLIAVFLSGHQAAIKLSSKDAILIPALIQEITDQFLAAALYFEYPHLLKNCDAYIATGSNNSARYFEQYFGKYPHIIRKNRTSIALLRGQETPRELDQLADDIHQFFGLGCRNVTHLYVPRDYDFVPLLSAFKKYAHYRDHNKYKNNYDYQLAVLLLNHQYYMSSDSMVLVESQQHFSPIAQLHYWFYDHLDLLLEKFSTDDTIQCVIGTSEIPFGQSQSPRFTDYADGVDTMAFLQELRKS